MCRDKSLSVHRQTCKHVRIHERVNVRPDMRTDMCTDTVAEEDLSDNSWADVDDEPELDTDESAPLLTGSEPGG